MDNTFEENQLEKILLEYQNYLKCSNKTENTIRVYVDGIRQYFQLYQVVNQNNLRLYKCYLVEHYKPQTINVRIRAINSFLEFLGTGEEKLKMVKVQKQMYADHVISQADYEYLKKCLLRDGNWLYYFVIRYMAATGLRVSEVIQVTAADVKNGSKELYSKDNKIRRIYIPKQLREETLKWLARKEQEDGFLFLNQDQQQLTPAAIRGQLKKFSSLYGINPKSMHPHSFRHRFAKNFIETIGDIAFLSDLLGHESIETTRIYLKRSSAEQYQIVNKVMNW